MKRLTSLAQTGVRSLQRLFASPNAATHTASSPLNQHGLVSRRRFRRFSVAIIMRSQVPGILETINGLTDYLNEHAPGQFECVSFDGKGDEKRLFSYATQIVRNYTMPYDAIISIGALASQVATRTSLLLNIPIPIIFGGVTLPTHLGIVYPGTRKKSNVTGIEAPRLDCDNFISLLYNVKKNIRKVLIPFNERGAWFGQVGSELARQLTGNNVAVELLPVSSPEDVARKVAPHLHSADTIMTMKDDVVINSLDQLVSLCNNYGITIYSTDLDSVAQGAAIGCSPKGAEIGVEVGKYLLHLFKDNAQPHELPIKSTTGQNFVGINRRNLNKQGIYLTPQEIDSLQNTIFYQDTDDDHSQKN